MIRTFSGIAPQIAASAYIDPAAQVIGDAQVGERTSIWPCAVLRGDTAPIRVGDECSIQDNSVLHGCVIEDDALIGIGSIILNGAKIGKGSIVAAGALVPEGMEVPPGMLAMGVPAKVKRAVTAEEQARFAEGVKHYVEKAAVYRESH